MSTVASLMTAEEYAQLADNGRLTELVRGKLVYRNQPYPRHGEICAAVTTVLRQFVKQHKLGRVMSNDSGVVTEHYPDTVRGADVCFYSRQRLPENVPLKGYVDIAPDLVFEVLSPFDRWSKVLAKVAEYLAAGVSEVCVLDPELETAQLYTQDKPLRTFTADQEMTFPDSLAGLSIRVSEFFE